MNEINAAQRMRMAAKEKAEADRVMVVTRAQGQPHLPPPRLVATHHASPLLYASGFFKQQQWQSWCMRDSGLSHMGRLELTSGLPSLQEMLRPSTWRWDFL